jgi:NAD(P)H-hydrate epimerase
MERLDGNHYNTDFELFAKARELSAYLKAYIILKGHYSALCLPDGNVVFNSTGNSGMATAGCGDVLTGLITGLLARGYNQADACKIGMYLHGLAGDLAIADIGKESLVAGDLITYLPTAFKMLGG